MKCNNCGNELCGSEKFCKSCGKAINTTSQTVNAQQQINTPKPKKKHGCLIALILFLVIVGIAVACVFIFLPGLFAPKSLGIESSREAYESAVAKLNFIKDTAPTSGSADDYEYTYGEAQQVDVGLTSEELTSFFNENRPVYYALKDVQIRINPDNTVEMSASMDTAYILNSVLSGKYSQEEIKNAVPALGILPKTVNLYAHISGKIQDNKSMGIDIQQVKVMGVALPADLYSASAQSEINSFIDDFIATSTEKTGGTVDSLRIEDGELKFSGKIPSSLIREKVG